MINVTNLNTTYNLTAQTILEAAMITSSNGKKSWPNMNLAEKALQVLSLGIWSPKYTQEQQEQAKNIISKMTPVQPMSGEKARVEANFDDFTKLSISISPSGDITASIIDGSGTEKISYFDGEKADKIKHNLPLSIHMPYLMKHSVPSNMEIKNAGSMRELLKIASQHSTSIVIPHTSERDPLAGTSPFNSVFIDAHQALGNVNIHVDGMALPPEAQNELSQILKLDSKKSNDIINALTPSEAMRVINLCDGTNQQVNNLYELLTCSSGVTALCSAFFQSYPLPILALNQEQVINASIYSAEHSMNLPNSCMSINISTTTQDGTFLVTNNTGLPTMSPNQPNKLGLLICRTEYAIPNNMICDISSMQACIHPEYSGSTIFTD
ncbi:hypothetical protein D6S13_24700 [Salmonella enterica subsp. enterica]|nr:hypothetical protein [Salmonella enterica subsp. enterica]